MFEPIGFDDVYGFELLAELAVGESFLLEPNHVGLGEIDKQPPGIFSERHLSLSEFEQEFRIGGKLFHRK